MENFPGGHYNCLKYLGPTYLTNHIILKYFRHFLFV